MRVGRDGDAAVAAVAAAAVVMGYLDKKKGSDATQNKSEIYKQSLCVRYCILHIKLQHMKEKNHEKRT